MAVSTEYTAQSGGRKRERAGKSRAKFSRKKSAGHADDFARSGGRRGIFARLFRKERPAWIYNSSGSRKSNYKENRFLFSRHRTPGKVESHNYLDKQNRKRAGKRERGNHTFKSKKYKRK